MQLTDELTRLLCQEKRAAVKAHHRFCVHGLLSACERFHAVPLHASDDCLHLKIAALASIRLGQAPSFITNEQIRTKIIKTIS